MEESSVSSSLKEESNNEVDPIIDIIDYLVRCANVSFKNASVDNPEVRNNEKIQYACEFYKQSPTKFLLQFGKYLSANHLQYFEKQHLDNKSYQKCLAELKLYHSNESRNKRVRNRRYKAMQKLQEDTDYFTEKQMMYRNPFLYDQLIGQYLTDDEIRERDAVGPENLTLLSMILDTVERNEMRQTKYEQMLNEDGDLSEETAEDSSGGISTQSNSKRIGACKEKQWGSFDVPDTEVPHVPDKRKPAMINANERNLLREEFIHEMYTSFIEGRDINFDYNSVDNDEEYDDLQQISQDAEDKYFDSEENDARTLEEHMTLIEEYGRKKSVESSDSNTDPLDLYMQHISYKL
ncbi:coiled-coil domain-containing protein 97 [Vanessa atalanta]|uniref:coiled-coil domain-containing protein 97 n=1 Tax=Vanessa atalanta TaxID=42275 RepID=UPI001FCCEE8B|nr:coiled-coil domain-containing protein 97 [Vanessa atalanta]